MSGTSFKLQGFQLAGALLCLVAGAGCSGSGASGVPAGTADNDTTDVSKTDDQQELPPAPAGMAGAEALDEGRDPLPDELSNLPIPASPTPAGCFAVLSHEQGTNFYSLWTYDPAARLLSQTQTDERGADPQQNLALYWKLDAAGRVSVRAGEGGSHPFRHNTRRDEHENPVFFRATYLDVLDLSDDLSGREYSKSEYTNEYDSAGLLVRQTVNSSDNVSSRTTTFEHDGDGRCSAITLEDGGVDRRDYDAAGRLAHRVLTGMTRGGSAGTFDSTRTYEHDEQGRLVSVTEAYAGQPGVVQRLRVQYRPDGSVVEERVIDTDTPDGYSRIDWSAGCKEIVPLRLREPGPRCQTETNTPGDFYLP